MPKHYKLISCKINHVDYGLAGSNLHLIGVMIFDLVNDCFEWFLTQWALSLVIRPFQEAFKAENMVTVITVSPICVVVERVETDGAVVWRWQSGWSFCLIYNYFWG